MTSKNPAPTATNPVTDRRVQPDGPLSGEVQRGGNSLDTSGVVYVPRADSSCPFAYTWTELPPFAQGYVGALFASQREALLKPGRNGLIAGFSDLAPEALALILKDCERFTGSPIGRDPFMRNAPREDHLAGRWLKQRDTEKRAGAALWAYRNGDRDAFFDNGIVAIDVQDSVERLAKSFPPLTLYLNDEGKVCLRA